MNKLLTGVLMLCVLTGVAAAQPYRLPSQTTFAQWAQTQLKNDSYFDWKKGFDKKVARQQAAAKKAFLGVAKKSKTQASIRWWNQYDMVDGSVKFYSERYTCSVLLLDYNEKNSLGTVTVAFKNDCFKAMQKNAQQDWFTFSIYLYQFDTPCQKESFEYQYNNQGDETLSKDLKAFKHVKISGEDYYQFPMPVRNPALKTAFKKLFPTPKSFLTAEQAALALKLMPNHSDIEAVEQR